MKILYIAPFRDFSGYATAARGYLRALDEAGADMVARPIRYDKADPGSEYKATVREEELMRRPLNDVDVIIQHLTPNEMRLPRSVSDKVNIAVVAWETTRIPEYWVKKLNQFDSVMTFCDASVKAFVDSGVTVPVHKIPHTFDIASYDLSDVKPLKVEGASDYMDGRYIFYNVSQFSQKKGLDILVQAYYAAFWDRPESVALVLKTYINMGGQRKQEQEFLSNWIKSIRAGMRLPQYPPIILMTDTLSDEKMQRLHAMGDCYVCSSRAEGWCIPAFEAMAYGKPLVTSAWGGMGEFAGTMRMSGFRPANNVHLVDYSLEPLVGQQHNDPELYTAQDLVAQPSISSMAKCMQNAVEAEVDPVSDLDEFDHASVGPQMLDIIRQVARVEETTNV